MRSFTRSTFLAILSLFLLSSATALPYAAPSNSVDVGFADVEVNSFDKRQVRSADYGSDGGPPGDPSQPSSQTQPSDQPSTESSSDKVARSMIQGGTALDAIPLSSREQPTIAKYNPSAPTFGKRNARKLKFFKWASDSSNHAGEKRDSAKLTPERAEIEIGRNPRNGSFSRQPKFLPRYQRRQTSIEPNAYSASTNVKPLRTAQVSVPSLESQPSVAVRGRTRSLSASSGLNKSDGDCPSCIVNVEVSPVVYSGRSVSETLSAVTSAPDDTVGQNDVSLEPATGDMEVNSDVLNAAMDERKRAFVEPGSVPAVIGDQH